MTVPRSVGAQQPEDPVVLRDRYELTGLLASGATSRVYLARDVELNRTVAVKLLAGHPGPEHVERLRREARAVAAIDDPHVVSVYDMGVADETVFVVMEYVRGESLRTVLAREGHLAVDETRQIAVQVCAALSAAHSAGVVHRDISPGNIMLGPAGMVTVLDFGIARGPASVFETSAGQVWGTPAFLSPEQARGEPPDVRSDLYSLGCCLYQMVTGRAPFEASSPWGMVTAHLNERPTPPREVEPTIPQEVQRIILRALAKDPHERYPAAEALRAELSAVGQQTGAGTLGLPVAEQQTAAPEQQTVALARGGGATAATGPELDEPVEADTGTVRRWLGLTLMAVAGAVLVAVVVLALVQNLGQ